MHRCTFISRINIDMCIYIYVCIYIHIYAYMYIHPIHSNGIPHSHRRSATSYLMKAMPSGSQQVSYQGPPTKRCCVCVYDTLSTSGRTNAERSSTRQRESRPPFDLLPQCRAMMLSQKDRVNIYLTKFIIHYLFALSMFVHPRQRIVGWYHM